MKNFLINFWKNWHLTMFLVLLNIINIFIGILTVVFTRIDWEVAASMFGVVAVFLNILFRVYIKTSKKSTTA